jgi:hypothetical protein
MPSPEQVMANLRHLPKTAAVVLFTPVITPAATVAANATNKTSAVDPFEVLGRSLASYHPRIRHVPYVPAIGFTDTHDAFLSQADAVIVVVCEPHTSKRECLGRQLAFAEKTQEAVGGAHGGPVRNPPILVQCGDPDVWPDGSQSFGIVMKSGTLTSEVAQQISRTMFGAKK